MIIDGGSCANVVLLNKVKKLNLYLILTLATFSGSIKVRA